MPFSSIRPPFHTQWTEPWHFCPVIPVCLLLLPTSTLRSWPQPAKAEIQEQGRQAALLLNSHSNRSTEVGKGQRKSLSSPQCLRIMQDTQFTGWVFCGLDQRGSPVPRRKEGNTVLCHINTGLSTDCNKSVRPVLLWVKLLQEF